MGIKAACRIALCLSLVSAGCGKCCLSSPASRPVASPTAAEDSDSACCEVESTSAPVELKLVKMDGLEEAIQAQTGKIVILDVWATFCVPCKKEFPRLVKLHEEHAKDGLVCLSLSVDEKEDQEKALLFLKSRGARFANYLIDEPAMVWQNHYVLKGVPAVFIWDRTGKQVARFDGDDPDNQFTYAQVEKKIEELLALH